MERVPGKFVGLLFLHGRKLIEVKLLQKPVPPCYNVYAINTRCRRVFNPMDMSWERAA